MNKPVTSADLVTPKVTTGPLPASRKVYARPMPRPNCACRCARSCSTQSSGEPPLPVYDTTGLYSDPDVDDRRREGPRARPHRMGEGARRRRAI